MTIFNAGSTFPSLANSGYNIIRQLDISEPQHSLILGFILNPNEKHGFGDIFLKEFFDIVISDKDFTYDNNEKWRVSVEKGRFDILIRNKQNTKIVIIENKSNGAKDQHNQLYRYWFKGIYQTQYRLVKQGEKVFNKIIYLVPKKGKQYTKQTITGPKTPDKNYPDRVPENIIKTVYFKEELLWWLEKCMSLVERTEDMYFYIKQYADFWRNPMEKETVEKVNEFFSEKDLWLSFWNLAGQRKDIRNLWWKTFKESMDKCFTVDNVIEGWSYISSGNMEFRWFLKGFDETSLHLIFRDWNEKYSLLLWADPKYYDTKEIDRLLEQEEYLPIIFAFKRRDSIPSNSNVKVAEKGNFSFGDDPMNGDFEVTRLAWYANYKTDEFLSQIITKIDRFRKDKEVTDLLRKINNSTKKEKK